MSRESAIAQLRHLYRQMICHEVHDTAEAARGLLGPAIAELERDEKEFVARMLQTVKES